MAFFLHEVHAAGHKLGYFDMECNSVGRKSFGVKGEQTSLDVDDTACGRTDGLPHRLKPHFPHPSATYKQQMLLTIAKHRKCGSCSIFWTLIGLEIDPSYATQELVV